MTYHISLWHASYVSGCMHLRALLSANDLLHCFQKKVCDTDWMKRFNLFIGDSKILVLE